MNFLFRSWLQSFLFFSPLKLRLFFFTAARRFYRALKMGFTCLGFMFVIDALLFWLFGGVILKALSSHEPKFSFGMVFAVLLINVNWFVFSTAITLFIRKRDIGGSIFYLKQIFPAYLQLLFFWLCIAMFFVVSGISRFPHIPWIIVAIYTAIAYLIVFYWLDCPMSFKDFFISLEKAVNAFFYNLPAFIFLLMLLWGFDFGVKALFFGAVQAFNIDSIIFAEKIDHLIKMCPSHTDFLLKFLGLRYLVFFLKNFWVSCVFVLYDQKKGILYTNSCFDCLSDQQ